MKVFISWSGNDSKKIAELIAEWIPNVLQNVGTWVSSADIDKGAMWMADVGEQLKEVSFGILCLTPDNIDAPWILFEAGALSKGLSKSRVCPLLINLTTKDLKQPLAIFNATMPIIKEDMLKLIKTLNVQQKCEMQLTNDRVEQSFGKWWNDFEDKFATSVKSFKSIKTAKARTTEEMVPEILELSRSIQKLLQNEQLIHNTNPLGILYGGPSQPLVGDFLKYLGGKSRNVWSSEGNQPPPEKSKE